MYKYKTRFNSVVKARNLSEFQPSVSRASLDSLKSLIPASVDLNNNIDLLGVAFDAAVINRFNRNGDGIDTAAAIACKDFFLHKPTNIEHDSYSVVGHIVGTGFSSFGESKVLTLDEVKNEVNPFNISLAAVVYRVANKSFAECLEDSGDNESPYFNKISASWEIGFNEYVIAVGSRNLANAKLVTEASEIKKISEYLSCNDGPGCLPTGEPVYRLITGRIYPLGVAFTMNPAAEVKGVVSIDNDDANEVEEEDEEEEDEEMEESDSKTSKCSIYIDTPSRISLNAQANVINNDNNMEIKELVAAFKAAIADQKGAETFSETAIASVSAKIAEQIAAHSASISEGLKKAEVSKLEAIASAEKLKQELSVNTSKLAETEARLKDIETSLAAKAAADVFSVRMGVLDAEYDFDDADRKAIAADLTSVSLDDKEFDSFKAKTAVLFRHKNKAHKAADEAAFKAKVEAEVAARLQSAEKVKTVELEKALASTSSDKTDIISTGPSAVEDWTKKFKDAFSKDKIVCK